MASERTSPPKLYVIIGSHACRTAMLMLKHKGIEYQRVELITGLHPIALRLHGFSGNPAPIRQIEGRTTPSMARVDRMGTVPALRIDGRRVMTNRAIARALDELQPEPALFPGDPEQHRVVEEAERWGDEVLQMAARRIALAGAIGPDGLINDGGDGPLGPLLSRHAAVRRVHSRVAASFFRADPRKEQELLAQVSALLDRVDQWIERGILNGAELNSADFMIAPSLGLLCYRPKLQPEIVARPAGWLVERLLTSSR